MKRLVAFLLVCVMAFSATMALAEADISIPFTVNLVPGLAEEYSYTTPIDFVSSVSSRAMFSIVVLLDYTIYLDTTTDESVKSDVDVTTFYPDFEKPSYVFFFQEKVGDFFAENTVGFAFCAQDGEYKALTYTAAENTGAYYPTLFSQLDGTQTRDVLDIMGAMVFENDKEELSKVADVVVSAFNAR